MSGITVKQHFDHWLNSSNESLKDYVAEWAAVIRKWHEFLKQHAGELRSALPDRTPAAYPEDFY